MVQTADSLFFAGPPDVVDPCHPLGAFEGRKGAVLRAVSANDGKQLSEVPLDSPPVFDGLIAAHGKIVYRVGKRRRGMLEVDLFT
jgi:hypothetical protein